MPLAPKISVVSVDEITALSVILKDSTGTYNASTNPGGYGAPNYATSDLDWAILYFRNYSDTDYSIQKLASVVDILAAGQIFGPVADDKIADGVWEVKYYPVIAHPVTPGVDTTVTWTVGSKTINLANADTLLAGAAGIILKNIDDKKIYFLDPSVALTSGTATVTETLPSTGTALVAITYEGDVRFMEPAGADDCIAKKTSKVLGACSCFSPEMQHLYLMMGKRQGANVHFTVKQNYQATHDIITQLAAECSNVSNCGC
jgi:hypothetical protein